MELLTLFSLPSAEIVFELRLPAGVVLDNYGELLEIGHASLFAVSLFRFGWSRSEHSTSRLNPPSPKSCSIGTTASFLPAFVGHARQSTSSLNFLHRMTRPEGRKRSMQKVFAFCTCLLLARGCPRTVYVGRARCFQRAWPASP